MRTPDDEMHGDQPPMLDADDEAILDAICDRRGAESPYPGQPEMTPPAAVPSPRRAGTALTRKRARRARRGD